jgi:diguanylate cyclase (GGDEF)-like protein/PAS domain S-box-containing protein
MDEPRSAASAEENRGEAEAAGGERPVPRWPVLGTDTAAGLLEAAPDAILGVDRSGAIALANLRVEELFGYARGELVGEAIEMLVPPEARERHQGQREGYQGAPRVRAMGEGQELRGRRKDGTEFPVEISLSPLSANGDVFVMAIVRDVSERKEAEAELRMTKDRLEEAQRLARLGSWEWDIANEKVIWSDELFRIYGLEPGEIEPTYERFLERVHPDDRDAVDDRNRKAFADHRPFEDVKRARRPDGSEFLMRTQGEVVEDADGNPIRMLGICEDVTIEKRAEEAQAMLASVVHSSDDAIITRGLDGQVTSWNPGAEQLYGYEEQEMVGREWGTLIPEDTRSAEDDAVRRAIAGERVEHYETRRRRKDGSLIDVSVTVSPLRDAEGAVIGIATIARDITERKRFEAQLKHLANNDPLTGLYNRYRFEEELAEELAAGERYGGAGAVLVLDLDNFKYVNDGFGHGAGDEVLRGMAELLRGRLRRSDVLARLGGDEFAILLHGADEGHARSVAQVLLEQVRAYTPQVEGQPVRMTASIGVTLIDQGASNPGDLMADADRAMYDAKESGRDRVTFLDAEDRNSGPGGGRGWEHRIRTALDEDRFELHLQPIVELASGEVTQGELLVRMRGDDGLIPPHAFLGDAERLGLIHAIDGWVVGQAIELLALQPDISLEVNLSGRSTGDEQILRLIRGELEQSGVAPERLIFEITETAAIASIDQARRFAEALRDLGCRFALDDFGAGFGSFYYLKHIPVDFLKIDGDFVRSPRSQADDLVVESIVHMAKGLGKQTIAEFVEDEGTLEALRAQGVDYAQGFHVGRPAPVDEQFARS